MSPTDQRRSPVQRQLEAYEESWQREHKEAMACRDLEDTIAVGVGLFRILERAERSWRDRVFRGTEEVSADYDAMMQGLYRSWLQVSDEVHSALPGFERRFGAVDGAGDLRECVTRVRGLLQGWRGPALARAVGFREMELTPEAATDLQQMVDEAKRHPPQMPKWRMETRGPSFLR